MKEQIPLKYACLDKFEDIINSCTDEIIKNYLLDLQKLIIYQMEIIKDQRMAIIANRHHKAWTMYQGTKNDNSRD